MNRIEENTCLSVDLLRAYTTLTNYSHNQKVSEHLFLLAPQETPAAVMSHCILELIGKVSLFALNK